MLHPNARWIEGDGGAFLHWLFACVATVRADGTVTITGWGGHVVGGKAASVAQGKRFVERWVAKQGAPWKRRDSLVRPACDMSVFASPPPRPVIRLPLPPDY